MTVTVEPRCVWMKTTRYYVKLAQGVQSFELAYDGTQEECTWMAKMVRKALRAHDSEQTTKREARLRRACRKR